MSNYGSECSFKQTTKANFGKLKDAKLKGLRQACLLSLPAVERREGQMKKLNSLAIVTALAATTLELMVEPWL